MKPRLEILVATYNIFISVEQLVDDKLTMKLLRNQQGGLDYAPCALHDMGLNISEYTCYVAEGAFRFGDPPISAYYFETIEELWGIYHKLHPEEHRVESMIVALERMRSGGILVKRLGGPKLYWADTLQEARTYCTPIPSGVELGYVVDGDFHKLESDADWVMAALML